MVDGLYTFAAGPGTILSFPRIVQVWGWSPDQTSVQASSLASSSVNLAASSKLTRGRGLAASDPNVQTMTVR